ncbi:SDH family Clp fold serine proteinase [Neopusillimonas maritima]|uniref:SppA protein n=1 Tax=Neopusillimonas maritima TaxID=2026239 RepID=A0A3A1Z0U3_9BURK|nr:hypothetical protein [Neopusillimonas maritima]RIY41977.1 hypothetical protein CJP73_00585 [Neopusillimonas maritima]
MTVEDNEIIPGRDVIIVSRGIDRQLHYDLSRRIQENKAQKSCTLFLTTRGGDPNGGYRIGRCLRHHYEHIRLVVPSYCKSAGTLVAIAADELAIGDLGELGPLDVQVRKQNEMLENNSGLDFNESMEAALQHVMRAFRYALVDIRGGTRISTRLAGDFATKVAASIAAPLYSQIDPNRVGEMQRAIAIALEYGQRLNDLSKSLTDHDSLRKLVADYPSHSFVIDRKEAGTLFANVSHPTEMEVSIYERLWDHMQDESNFGPIVLPSSSSEVNNENHHPSQCAEDAAQHDSSATEGNASASDTDPSGKGRESGEDA